MVNEQEQLEEWLDERLKQVEFFGQTHREMHIERLTDITLGFFLAWGFMEIFARVIPREGIWVFSFALLTTIGMTFVSYTRAYVMRMWHNKRLIKKRKEQLLRELPNN